MKISFGMKMVMFRCPPVTLSVSSEFGGEVGLAGQIEVYVLSEEVLLCLHWRYSIVHSPNVR